MAIVGATGAVGSQLLEILDERKFPVQSVRLLASEASAGEILDFQDKPVVVEALAATSFSGTDMVFFAASRELSKEFCPVAVESGALCIDLSGYWGRDEEVPLVVPEVNPQDLGHFRLKGIVASPDSSTIPLVMALKPLQAAGGIRRVVVSVLRSVSAFGVKGIDELRGQSGELLNGRPAESKVFSRQVAFNCFSHSAGLMPNGYTVDEMSISRETRKILASSDLQVTATSVTVPIFYGCSEMVNIELKEKIEPGKVRELMAHATGLTVFDDTAPGAILTLNDAVGQDSILVGRIRADESSESVLNMWLVSDNLRKGAATNAVQIAELLVNEYL
ncbi:aspartate-semialdehyde dehydrogenase [Desulfuromonas sp. KJ2020]|uniref:aspartate-semialdehyde dehydrogenase n=1 Tax=Desulfuromonas sp. KJ2020 TaxID=2919173 RepID=UPI00353226BB